MTKTAFIADTVFDGEVLREGMALIVEHGRVAGLMPADDCKGLSCEALGPGTLMPGFVDLQVNGGGGALFNDAPDNATLRDMAEAHARLGATTILPTLISDAPEITQRAVRAVIAACAGAVPGIAGLHLEGPHLAVARKGAHDADHFRILQDTDVAAYADAAAHMPVMMITLAPEMARPERVAALAAAGILVSIGHSDAEYAACRRLADAGARCVTHLFNAMSPLGSRAPGVVGFALDHGGVSAGLIADGVHVHPASMAAALRAKQGPGEIFLVSDAMAPAGTDMAEFTLQGRRILRGAGRLTLEDGTLAGADLDLARAIKVLVEKAAVPRERAMAMATSVPARIAGLGARAGYLRPGAQADFVHLGPDLGLETVWRAGEAV